MGQLDAEIVTLQQQQRACEVRFESEARKRGFNPAQIENMALPSRLAQLYLEREELNERLARLLEQRGRENCEMSTEVERIQNQLQRAFAGEAWHGPSLMELLKDVDAARAAAHPIPGAHSIWELVLHIAAWDKAVTRRLGGDRGTVSDSENFPAIDDTSEASWQKTIETLQQNHQELLSAMGKVADGRLDDPVVEGMSSAYVHMHGAVQHDLYHAGQIAILKKA